MPTPREAYVNDVNRQAFTGERMRAADFGSAGETIGRAAQGLGQEVQRFGETVRDIQEQDDITAAQEADNIRMAKRLQRYYDGPEAYFNQQGRNALIDQEKLNEDLRKIDEEAAAELLANKPRARRMYDRLTLKRNRDEMPQVFRHAANERVKYQDAVDGDAFDLAIDTASNSEDPAVIEQGIATAGNIAEGMARRKGMADENGIKQARQSGIGKAIEAIAQKMELKSPAEAQAFVITHADQMDPQDAGKLLETLAPAAAQERAASDISQFLVVPGARAQFAEGEAPEAFEAAPPPSGAVAEPTPMPPMAALKAAVLNTETPGGKHIDPKTGKMYVSKAGAQGAGQIMRATGGEPGYGVKPLQNNSYEEHVRFSGDLLEAYIKEFDGNIVLGLTAYNWGPGNVEDHIKKVGDPSKGQISDAAFVNSIPIEEAREYAAKVLSKNGVSISGVAGPEAGKGMPVQVGQEIDLDATINNIRNSDRSFVDKQALIAEATRLHSYGRQVKAETEELLSDAVQTEINKLPVDGFTSVQQLPLELRQRLPSHPELYNSVRNMANTNKEAKEAEFDAKKKAEFKSKLAVLEQDLMALSWSNPDVFQSIDFYNSPAWAKMGTAKVTEWMKRQQQSIESASGKGANHDAIRTMVGRYTSKEMQKDPKKMGLIYQTVITLEERALNQPDRKGKPLTDTEREAIVMQATAEATYTVNGKSVKGIRAEAAAAGAKRVETDIYGYARAQLQQRWGRVPLPSEVEAAVQQYRRAQGNQ